MMEKETIISKKKNVNQNVIGSISVSGGPTWFVGSRYQTCKVIKGESIVGASRLYSGHHLYSLASLYSTVAYMLCTQESNKRIEETERAAEKKEMINKNK